MMGTEIREALIDILTAIQVQGGRAAPEISDNTRPLVDLEGFDSLNAEEAWVALIARLGTDFRHNPLRARRSRIRLTIAEIVATIAQQMNVPTSV